MLTPFL